MKSILYSGKIEMRYKCVSRNELEQRSKIIFWKKNNNVPCATLRSIFLSIIPLIPILYLLLINYFMPLLANLFPSTLICVVFYLLVSVETAPHQISKENCKNLSYCNHRGLCELRYAQNDNSKFEYFCSCYGEDWIGDDCSLGKNNSRIVNK